MEKKVSSIYEEAYPEISKKWNKFMESHYPKLKDAQEQLKKAELTGDTDEIKKAKDLYERTAMNITINNRRYQSMVDDTTEKIAHTNEIALAYINDQLPEIYTVNYNAFGEEKIKGYSFSLVNESAVKELATKDKMLLPTKKLDIPKDMRWNAKNINSQMIQGILQGENIPTMAKRLMNVTDMNRNSAIRNARTMTTAAENKGRQDSFEKATEDGVIIEREWVATSDERTRAWHADLDGVKVGIDEPWDNEYGGIMYPGDPSADPANVYNCRCSIRAIVKGFDWRKNKGDEVIEEDNTQYVNEMETKGYIGLSKEESDKFMRTYHNDVLLENNRADNDREGEKSGHIINSGFNTRVREGNVTEADKVLMKKIDNAIASNSIPKSMTLYRGASYRTIPGLNFSGKSIEEIKDSLNNMKGTIIGNNGYVQTSASSLRNFFTDSDISFQIMADEGTPAYISNYLAESEIILGRDTKFEIIKADIVDNIKDDWGDSVGKRIVLIVKLLK